MLKNLGAERYRAFAVGYLVERGAPEAEARVIVEDRITPNPEIERRRQLEFEKNARKRQWIRTVLLTGLGHLKDGQKAETASAHSFWFSAAEVEVLLQRCRDWNIGIGSIRHYSDEQRWDKLHALTSEFATIEAAFADLLAQGCNERFSLSVFKIPDELTETEAGKNETATAPEKPEESP